jgi:hypothetical protein
MSKARREEVEPLANNAVIRSQVVQPETQLSSARRLLLGSLADI